VFTFLDPSGHLIGIPCHPPLSSHQHYPLFLVFSAPILLSLRWGSPIRDHPLTSCHCRLADENLLRTRRGCHHNLLLVYFFLFQSLSALSRTSSGNDPDTWPSRPHFLLRLPARTGRPFFLVLRSCFPPDFERPSFPCSLVFLTPPLFLFLFFPDLGHR